MKNQPELTSRQKNEFVWTSEFGAGKSVKLRGAVPWRSVKLDGRKGVGSFGTITRKNDSTHSDYLVAVQGDPDAPTDTPDLLLYVERTQPPREARRQSRQTRSRRSVRKLPLRSGADELRLKSLPFPGGSCSSRYSGVPGRTARGLVPVRFPKSGVVFESLNGSPDVESC